MLEHSLSAFSQTSILILFFAVARDVFQFGVVVGFGLDVVRVGRVNGRRGIPNLSGGLRYLQATPPLSCTHLDSQGAGH